MPQIELLLRTNPEALELLQNMSDEEFKFGLKTMDFPVGIPDELKVEFEKDPIIRYILREYENSANTYVDNSLEEPSYNFV